MNEENQPQNPPQPVADGQISRPPHVTETPQKALRTYESDVADVLAHKNISTASIAIAENKRQTGQETIGSDDAETTQKSGLTKKIIFGVASLIVIILGLGGAYYLYSLSPLAARPVTQQIVPVISSIVPADTHVSLNIDSLSTANIVNSIKNETTKVQSPNSIKEIVLTQTTNGQKFKITAGDALKYTGTHAPDTLARTLSDDWMLGIYADSNGNKNVFVVMTINYFQNAFAAMLQWENLMPDDLKKYFQQNIPVDATLSSTTPVSNGVIRGSFIDRIIKNKDVREFVTSDGQTLFLYSFIDNNKLIITSSESTLTEILTRLEQKAFIR